MPDPRDHLDRLRRLNGEPADRSGRELIGVVDAVLWTALDGTAVIARLHGGRVVKGPLAAEDNESLECGVSYRFLGRWEDHPRHGAQFTFSTYLPDAPHSRPGVIKYLQDEAPNIGRARAEKLWQEFGTEAVAVLRAEPARVVAAAILSACQAAEASAALRAAEALEATKIELFSLFAGRGLPGSLIRACISEWGARSATVIRRNPFALLINDIPGAGFRRCDRLYLDLGLPADRLKRQMLCAWHALREDTTGHTWLRMGYALAAIERAVSGSNVNPQRAVALGVRGGWLSTHESPPGSGYLWVAEALKASAERSLAADVRRLLGPCAALWPSDLDSLGAFLSEHQRERLLAALARPVGILDGSPGTGKTQCAAALIQLIVQRWGIESVAVCCPTGKAAVRITGVLRGIALDATTIHRLLEIGRSGRDGRGWGFKRNRGNPLPQRFIVVDEASMLDTTLASKLFEALADGTHVLLVGDTGQLPPVQHGAPLRDLIAAGVPCGTLTEIKRQGGEPNTIVQACADIKTARRTFATVDRYDPARGHNLRLIEVPADNPAQSVEVLLALVRQFKASGKFDPVWNVQVLSAMNTASEVARVPSIAFSRVS
jgi:exodeoxyribonuclease V alpha subunit